jgi:hypothetical protein
LKPKKLEKAIPNSEGAGNFIQKIFGLMMHQKL